MGILQRYDPENRNNSVVIIQKSKIFYREQPLKTVRVGINFFTNL